MKIKYPHIKVKLTDESGNAFVILAACSSAARKAGLPQEEINAFLKEAKSGEYYHLVGTAMQWFDCN